MEHENLSRTVFGLESLIDQVIREAETSEAARASLQSARRPLFDALDQINLGLGRLPPLPPKTQDKKSYPDPFGWCRRAQQKRLNFMDSLTGEVMRRRGSGEQAGEETFSIPASGQVSPPATGPAGKPGRGNDHHFPGEKGPLILDL